ncbi:hypothetical protein H2248_008500 [Termitomyces sp. 'cryptogamus']|nr:hypothetical protein H2248_008500 [Termitomyces sp. 'cryptogamus']
MSCKDPCALLGLSPNASMAEIKKAYKRTALRWHPDRHQKDADKEHAKGVFAEITTAYQTLLRDCNRPLTAVGAKLRTRLPTPMPSLKSLSEDSTRSASAIDPSHSPPPCNHDKGFKFTHPSSFSGSFKARHGYDVLTGSEHVSSRAVDNPSLHWNYRKPAITPQTRQPPSLPTGLVRNGISACNVRADVSPSWAQIAMPTHHLDENLQISKSGPPLQPLSTGGCGEWIYSLPLTLEDMFGGKHYQFCLVRHFLSGRSKNVIIEINVPSGCRSGTKIICRGVGNELPNGTLQDVVFVIEEAPHPYFSRVEDDLYLDINIPWTDSLAQRREKVKIKGIDGKELLVCIDHARHKMLKGELYVRGAGMPIRARGKVIGRSDLVIRWEIQTPPTRIRHFLGRFSHLRTKY